MMKAIKIFETGNSDKLILTSVEKPVLEKDSEEVLIKNHYSGVNFLDIYQRSGLIKVELPFIIGREGSGEIVEVGDRVTKYKVGDRVCYVGPNSYAEYTIATQDSLAVIPDDLDFKDGASLTLQGMAAHYLIRSTFKLNETHTCLIQAGAGGLGQLLIQMAKIVGAKVITTVSNDEKAKICKDLGADIIINYSLGENLQNLSKIVKESNQGKGVDVVYDGVGLTTWNQSLQSLKPFGLLCLYGSSSGLVPPVDLSLLAPNSLYITRPSLVTYTSSESNSIPDRMNEIFKWISEGKLKRVNPTIIKFENVKDAHDILQSRNSKGKIILEI